MNLKKLLQQMAEKDYEKLLTEEDRLFCKQLAERVDESERQEKTKKQDSKKD